MSTFSDAIDISTTPEAAFEAISHLEAMGKFSPENTGGHWLKGASGPGLGVKFRGTNSLGKDNWSTLVTIVAYDVPRSFAFEVSVGPVKVSRWDYAIEPTATGCRVTESWIDRRSSFAKKFSKGVDREEYTKTSIRTTLENLKAHLEI